jgi:hypothetical protein
MKNIPLPEKIIYAVVLLLVGAGAVISHIDQDFLENKYMVEDGVIEWLTVFGFLAGMVVCFRRVVLLRSEKPLLFLAATMMLGLAYLFCAGEEISWGQRVFGWGTGDFFKSHNAQEETNLHNLRIGGVKLNKLIFSKLLALVLALYFCVMSPLHSKKQGVARFMDSLAIPVPRMRQFIACAVMAIIAQVLTDSTNKGELAEFGGSWIFLMILVYPINRAVFEPQKNETKKDEQNDEVETAPQ